MRLFTIFPEVFLFGNIDKIFIVPIFPPGNIGESVYLCGFYSIFPYNFIALSRARARRRKHGAKMIEEIKKTTYNFTQCIAKGEDAFSEYLDWFASLPAEFKDYARNVYEIFEQLSFRRISANDAKIKWFKITAELKEVNQNER